MSIAQDLRANDAERSWLWENRGEVVELAEELMAGWNPGDAIDIGELYRRADALVQEGHYLPPQVAEVVRLALAALAGDTVPVRHAPDPKTAAVLDNMADLLERGSAKLRGELQGQSAPATPRGQALGAAEFELREVWTYFTDHLDAQLARAGDGSRRAKALGAALGDHIGPLLA